MPAAVDATAKRPLVPFAAGLLAGIALTFAYGTLTGGGDAAPSRSVAPEPFAQMPAPANAAEPAASGEAPAQ